jgi:hypothetical protein
MQTEWVYVVVMWVEFAVLHWNRSTYGSWKLEPKSPLQILSSHAAVSQGANKVISKTNINPIYPTILSYSLTLDMFPFPKYESI